MPLLKVYLLNTLEKTLELKETESYVAGRKEGAEISLKPEPGISREHFRIHYEDGVWKLKVLSRFSEVLYRGEKVKEADLDHGGRIVVPPYEFEFLLEERIENATQNQAHEGPVAENDKTALGNSNAQAYLKVTDSLGNIKSMVRLESGDLWVAGREPSLPILIYDNRVSRKQFEIRRDRGFYYITDLGSVNGTFVNGQPLKSGESLMLRSGDAISVLDNNLFFELHDPQFKNKLELVKSLPPLLQNHPDEAQEEDFVSNQEPEEFQQSNQEDPTHSPTPHFLSSQTHSGDETPNPRSDSKKFDFKKNRPRLILAAVAVLILAYGLADISSETKPSQDSKKEKLDDPLAKLTPEQQALVRQSYQLAKNYYMQGRYELTKSEILKIKELVPKYQDSDQIEKLAEEAIYIQKETANNERLEKEKLEREARIKSIVDKCELLVRPTTTLDQANECLSPAIQIDPTYEGIRRVREKVEMHVAQKAENEARRKVHASLVAQLRALYEKAKAIEDEFGPLEGISAYEKVIASKLPDPGQLKGKAKAQIEKIKTDMATQSQQYKVEADRYVDEKKLKEAVLSLRKALKANPLEEELQDRIDQYISDLRKQMMGLYQEGILEENFGNVDGTENKSGAKEKWKKIIELDVPDGEYYNKAKIKLKRYGAY